MKLVQNLKKDIDEDIIRTEVCVAGELTDDYIQKKLIENGCLNLIDVLADFEVQMFEKKIKE